MAVSFSGILKHPTIGGDDCASLNLHEPTEPRAAAGAPLVRGLRLSSEVVGTSQSACCPCREHPDASQRQSPPPAPARQVTQQAVL